MIEKCPKCSVWGVRLVKVRAKYYGPPPYYYCNNCGWIGCSSVIKKLQAMGQSIEPATVYLIQLLNRVEDV